MLFHLLYLYGAAVAWGFVILYTTRRFYRSAVGWNLMLFTASIAVAFTLFASTGPRPTPDLAGVPLIWLFLVVMVDLLLTHRLALLVHDIHETRHR